MNKSIIVKLSEFIWQAFSTGSVYSQKTGASYYAPLIILKKEDLQNVIKEFMLQDE